jgi:hypothetical protein
MDKGKSRASEIIGLVPDQPRVPSPILPSMDAACQEAAKLWPARISPNDQPIPETDVGPGFPNNITLTAPSCEQLGKLLLKLVERMIIPQVVDLTDDDPQVVDLTDDDPQVVDLTDDDPQAVDLTVVEHMLEFELQPGTRVHPADVLTKAEDILGLLATSTLYEM